MWSASLYACDARALTAHVTPAEATPRDEKSNAWDCVCVCVCVFFTFYCLSVNVAAEYTTTGGKKLEQGRGGGGEGGARVATQG